MAAVANWWSRVDDRRRVELISKPVATIAIGVLAGIGVIELLLQPAHLLHEFVGVVLTQLDRDRVERIHHLLLGAFGGDVLEHALARIEFRFLRQVSDLDRFALRDSRRRDAGRQRQGAGGSAYKCTPLSCRPSAA